MSRDRTPAAAAPPAAAAASRIDKWLWCARFYKSRSLAATAVSLGRVQLNGERVKPARAVKPGDVLTLALGGRELELCVVAIPLRRGPAPEARRAYEESAASLAAGERWRSQHRLAALSVPRPPGRPDKQERRELLALARRQGRD